MVVCLGPIWCVRLLIIVETRTVASCGTALILLLILRAHLSVYLSTLLRLEMSSVSELRRMTTQERLRSDHIALMEVLQASVDENIRLKAEITKLKSSGSGNGEGGGGGEGEAKEGNGETAAFMLQRVLAADANVAALTAEVKVLKSKLASADLETRALKKSSSSNESLRRELDALLQAQRERDARDEARALAEAEAQAAAVLALERAQALQAAPAIEPPHAAAESAAAAATAADLAALQLRHAALAQAHADQALVLEELRAELARSAAAAEAAALRSAALEAELGSQAAASASRERAARDAARVQQDIETALRDELHAQSLRAEAERAAVAELARQLETAAGRVRAYEDIEKTRASAPPPSSFFASFSSSSSSSSKYGASEPEPRDASDGPDGSLFLTGSEAGAGVAPGGPGGLFEEFVRLKKENRTLRLQLASLSGAR